MNDLNKRTNSFSLPSTWWTLLAVITIVLWLPCTFAIAKERIRKPAVAGSFYPKDQEELKRTVDTSLLNVKQEQIEGKILGLISPHAGYVYSGQVAAYSYRQINKRWGSGQANYIKYLKLWEG